MNITSEQLSILESFVCQRLSSDSDNLRLVNDFTNHINDAIAQTLKNEAEALKYVGCQYLFLFAADKSREEKLVRYYENQLNFIKPDELATAKPFYDFTCKFMCHDVSTLKRKHPKMAY